MLALLYHDVLMRVPAYRRFLKKTRPRERFRGVAKEIASLPFTNKDEYLRKYPLPDLCWDGQLDHQQTTIAATSGSTGRPFYFPRLREQDMQYAAIAEMYLRSNFSIHNTSTLYIVGWGMGVWIGGVFSYAAARIVADRGKYPLSVITPGTSQDEILKAIEALGPLYEQVIIGGYPPMIKDLIDEGNRRRISWKRYYVKFIFSAEGFSEEFRDYILRNTGLKNPYTDTLNHYGTVDLGTMAHETPLSILIRRIAQKNPQLNQALFGDPHRQPTLAQYIPELFFFEQYEDRLVCSARSGLPLVRYDLMDSGGVKSLAQMYTLCRDYGVNLELEISRAHIKKTIWNLPFVYVFERKDFTVKLSGANIFPEEIRRALEHGAVASFVTGKCTLEVDVNDNLDQYLTVYVELKKNIRASRLLEERIRERVIEELMTNNSEYAYLAKQLPPERMTPRIALRPFRDSAFFSAPGKHRWVRK